MLNHAGEISAAQLGYFALAVLPLVYVFLKHGKSGILGWFFLIGFCCLRVVGAAMIINAEINHTFSSIGVLLSQVGLAPLVFGLAGVTHEATQTVAHRHKFILGWSLQIVIHLIGSTGLALIIVGALNAATPGQTANEINQATAMIRTGASLYLVLFFLIALTSIVSFWQPRTVPSEKRLALASILCLPELFMRVLYIFLGAVINSPSWGVLNGGSLPAQIVLEVIPEFLIILALVVSGIMTKSLPSDRRAALSGNSETAVIKPFRN